MPPMAMTGIETDCRMRARFPVPCVAPASFVVVSKDRPKPDIVGPRLFRRPGLLDAVGRDADDLVAAQKPSRRFDRQIVLPEMHAVGIRRRRDVRVIVQDEQRLRPAGHGREQPRRFVNRPSRTAFVPVLEQPDARRTMPGPLPFPGRRGEGPDQGSGKAL